MEVSLPIRKRARSESPEVPAEDEIEGAEEEKTQGQGEGMPQKRKKKKRKTAPRNPLKKAENRTQLKLEKRAQRRLARDPRWRAEEALRKEHARNSWDVNDIPDEHSKDALYETLEHWSLKDASEIFPAQIAPRERKESGFRVTLRDRDAPLLPVSDWPPDLFPALRRLSRVSSKDHAYAMSTLQGIVSKRQEGWFVGESMQYVDVQKVREVLASDVREAIKVVQELRPRGAGWQWGSDEDDTRMTVDSEDDKDDTGMTVDSEDDKDGTGMTVDSEDDEDEEEENEEVEDYDFVYA